MGTKQSSPVTSTQSRSESKTGTLSCNEIPVVSTSIMNEHHHIELKKEDQQVSALDVKITNALRELKKKRLQEDKDIHHDPFTKIMLKFPLVAQAFNSVRSTFAELDKEKKGYIVYADMEAAFERLGAEFSKEEMSQVFQESDMCENGKLTFKEFVVCLAIGFVLHKIPSLESKRLSIFYAPMSPSSLTGDAADVVSPNKTLLFGEGNKLRVAFQLAIDAFLWFDVNGDGEISRNEMASRLNSSTQLHSPIKKKAPFNREKPPSFNAHSETSMEIWERRFHEMDWNHDGAIQFKEFLMAFESWVGMDDEDEEKVSFSQ